MNTIVDLINNLKTIFLYIFIGGVGGIVYNLVISKKITFLSLLRCMIVSSFSGFLGGVGSSYFGLGLDASLFCSGIFGFCGGFGILIVLTEVTKKLNIDVTSIADSFELLQTSGMKLESDDILIKLIKEREISLEDYDKILNCDKDVLLKLLKNNKITGKEYDIIIEDVLKNNDSKSEKIKKKKVKKELSNKSQK